MVEVTDDGRGAGRFSAWLAVAVATGVAVTVGVATGNAVSTVVSVGGVSVFTGGVRSLTDDDYARTAAGSVAVVVGAVGGFGGVALASQLGGMPVVVAGLTLAVLAAGLDAVADRPLDAVPELLSTFLNVGGVAGLGLVVGLVLSVRPVVVTATLTGETYELVVVSSAYAAVVSLQLLAVANVFLLRRALVTLDGWTASDSDALAALDRYGINVTDVPRTYWLLLGAQLVLPAFVPLVGLVESVLALLAPVGPAIESVLRSGAVHLPLVAVALLAGVVVVTELLRTVVVTWAGEDPPGSVARAAGGIVAVPVAAIGGLVAGVLSVPGAPPGETVPTAIGVLAVVLAVIIVVGPVVITMALVRESEVLPSNAGGYAIASVLLGAAAVGASPALPAVVVVAGVAGSILTWDLGRQGAVLVEQVGSVARTREAEITHAVASLLVAGIAVVVATVAAYLLGPVPEVAVGRERALAALALSLVALVAFARAAR